MLTLRMVVSAIPNYVSFDPLDKLCRVATVATRLDAQMGDIGNS